MNRTLVIVVALSVLFSIGPLADEIPSGFGPGNSKAKGLILTFDDWPPDGVDTDPLFRKLHSARLKAARKFPRFRVWLFEWDELQEGRRAENLCSGLLLDDRTSSLLESCEPDYLLHPARGFMPVRCRCARPRTRGVDRPVVLPCHGQGGA